MNIVDRAGTFRGYPIEWGVSESSGKFPQFAVKLSAVEMYVDPANPEQAELAAHFGLTEPGYVDWSSYNQEALGYFVLFNDKGPLLNYEQLQKALGWDGSSFSSLAAGDWSKQLVMFRVEDNEWPLGSGNIKQKVQWIDAADASPTRSLANLDADKLKGLDSQFAGMLNKKAAPKPAAAPAKAPTTPTPKSSTPAPVSAPAAPAGPKMATKAPPPGKPVAGASPSGSGSTPQTSKTTPPPSSPKLPTKAAAAAAEVTSVGVTKEDAWKFLVSNRGEKTEEQVSVAFVDAYTEIAPDTDEETLTQAQWLQIRNVAAKLLGIAV